MSVYICVHARFSVYLGMHMLFCMLECFLHFMQAKQGLPYVHSALLLLTAIAQSEKVWWVGEGQWVQVGGWGWRRWGGGGGCWTL